jgi:tRNA 2-thiouridine synthesizing protein E
MNLAAPPVPPSRKVDNKTLFDLYPGNPSKQAGKVAGPPESLRKGGY